MNVGMNLFENFDLNDITSLRLLSRGLHYYNNGGRDFNSVPNLSIATENQRATYGLIICLMPQSPLLTSIMNSLLYCSSYPESILDAGRNLRDYVNYACPDPKGQDYQLAVTAWDEKEPMFLGDGTVGEAERIHQAVRKIQQTLVRSELGEDDPHGLLGKNDGLINEEETLFPTGRKSKPNSVKPKTTSQLDTSPPLPETRQYRTRASNRASLKRAHQDTSSVDGEEEEKPAPIRRYKKRVSTHIHASNFFPTPSSTLPPAAGVTTYTNMSCQMTDDEEYMADEDSTEDFGGEICVGGNIVVAVPRGRELALRLIGHRTF